MASAQPFQRPDPWASFPGIKNYPPSKRPPTSIYTAQTSQRVRCNLRATSGSNFANISDGASDYSLHFIMHTSPYYPVLELRLSLYVNSKRPTEVLSLWFRQIIDDDQSTAFPRSHSQVSLLAFSDPLPANMPRGPLSFSSSLMDFQYKDFSESPLKDKVKPFKDANKEHYFTWKSKEAVTFNMSCPQHSNAASPDAQNAYKNLSNIAKATARGDEVVFELHTENNVRLAGCCFAHFVALPFPRPHSYWPWSRPTQGDEPLIDTSGSTGRWAQDSDFVDHFFGERGPQFFSKSGQVTSLNALTAPLRLRTLDPVWRFRDQRQYQTYILGCYVSEALDSQFHTTTWYNGVRTFYVIPKAGLYPHAPDATALMLCRLVPPDTAIGSASPQSSPPVVGEPVNLRTIGSVVINWTGSVVAIPKDVSEAQGFNTVVLVRTPRPPGFVISAGNQDFEATFGNQGRDPIAVQRLVNQVMQAKPTACPNLTTEQARKNDLYNIQTLLLAKDGRAMPVADRAKPYKAGLPPNTPQIVTSVCHQHGLNTEQASIVHAVFGTYRMVLVNAPPGTGKTQLTKAIMDVSDQLEMEHLFVAGVDSSIMSHGKPKIIIQDNASQILEAEAVAPLSKFCHSMRRIIMLGDILQLPPTVRGKNNVFSMQGTISLFERLSDTGSHVMCLKTQHRMHPDISQWCRDNIYPDLVDSPNAGLRLSNHKLAQEPWEAWCKTFFNTFNIKSSPRRSLVLSPVKTSDTKLPFGTATVQNTQSLCNLTYASMDFLLAFMLVRLGNFEAKTIMILAPYTAQVSLIKQMLASCSITADVQVRSWDASQGDEADIVVVDFVRTKATGLGVITDLKRLNVALSRAKCARIVIGEDDITALHKGPSQGNKAISNFMSTHQQKGQVYKLSGSAIEKAFRNFNTTTLRPVEDAVKTFIKVSQTKTNPKKATQGKSGH